MLWYFDLDAPELWIRVLRAMRRKYPEPEANGFQFQFLERRIEDLFERLYPHLDAFHAEIAELEFAYLPLLEDAPCLGLRDEIAHSPRFFHEMLCVRYLPDGGKPQALSEREERIASQCREFLWKHRYIPGMDEKGVDAPVFLDWLNQACELAEHSGHRTAFDIEIGMQLAHAPADTGGQWPHTEVCKYLEAGSEVLLNHFEMGCCNKRGAYSTNAGETNKQLAEQYAGWAEKIELLYPRTGRHLRNIQRDLEASSDQEKKRDYFGK